MEELNLNPETKENNENTKEKVYQPQTHARNANSRQVFKNPVLTCQFLKGYTDFPFFQNIKPEDIEDVSDHYKVFLGVEFESDTVKKIKITMNGQQEEVYVVSLIEHKSYVDYDIAMQLLRYMTVIWHEYKVKCNKEKENSSSLKSFRYPLIIPVVYYEGETNWTADMHLLDRIEHGYLMKDYLPDFQYKVVRIHDYTNDKLQEKNDEMALVMMINKVQSKQDYQELLNISKTFIETIYHNASGDIQELYRDIIWSLLMKMKVPLEQAQEMVEGLGVKGMGYLFENLKGIDIGKMQEEARELQKKIGESKTQLENQQSQIKDQQSQIKDQQSQIEDQQSQIQDQQSQIQDQQSQIQDQQSQIKDQQSQIQTQENKFIHLAEKRVKKLKNNTFSKDEIIKELMDDFELTEQEATNITDRCWK